MSHPDPLIHALITRPYVAIRAAGTHLRARLDEEHGEGVISVAIAVLIMAFLGALMWVAFKGLFTETTNNTEDQVGTIGN